MLTIIIIRVIYAVILCAIIYGFVMFIRVSKRAIKAFDIFISNHTNPNDTDGQETKKQPVSLLCKVELDNVGYELYNRTITKEMYLEYDDMVGYRMVATVTVWSGNDSETKTMTTTGKTA